jgi:hypothetical protein
MSAQSARAYFSIGEVLAQLQGEYDVSVSKIRFLESEGLIEPARSPSGYRRFGPADIERLRYILSAQRDQDPSPRAALGLVAAVPPDGGTAAAPDGGAAATHSLSRSELAHAAGIGDGELAELEEFGLVRRSGRHYGPEALTVARTAAELARFGVQPRHLRAIKAAAERETALIDQVVAPMMRQRSPGARDRAEETAREIAALTLRLHAAFLEAGLRTDLSQ